MYDNLTLRIYYQYLYISATTASTNGSPLQIAPNDNMDTEMQHPNSDTQVKKGKQGEYAHVSNNELQYAYNKESPMVPNKMKMSTIDINILSDTHK